MLQRGLLTIAEKQQHLQQTQSPYDTAKATATHETIKEQENRQELNESFKERINCLPIIELPQIKIEQDVELMEGIEEQEEVIEPVVKHKEGQIEAQQQNMEVDQEEEEVEEEEIAQLEKGEERGEISLKPVPQLLEPTSILKTSLLTGAANTLATLTAAAEQIARMPNESLTKSYAYLKEENKRTYALEDETSTAEDKKETTATTYTSILQTALMSKRPATLNVAATSTSSSSSTFALTKSLHVRTPDQVLKTAVTLATLGEIAAQQEQQQQQLQQQMQQQQQQQPHILVVPQVPRKMCTLPFKKLNFANVTPTSASSSTTATALALTKTNTASSICSTTSTATADIAAAATTTTNTTIKNNYLGSNIKTNTNLTNSSCILNTNNLAASATSNKRDKLENTTTTTTTATFFDTNHIINNVTICSSNNNSNNISNINYKSQTMATQTLKIPTIKPQLVTTQTQTEETSTQTPATLSCTSSSLMTPLSLATTLTHNSNTSSLQTASSGSSSSGLLRTAVSTNTKMLTQNSSTSSPSSTSKFLTKTKLEANEKVAAATSNASNVMGNIFKHVSDTNTPTLAKMNVIQQTNVAANSLSGSAAAVSENNSNAAQTATNVTVVVFETLLPED